MGKGVPVGGPQGNGGQERARASAVGVDEGGTVKGTGVQRQNEEHAGARQSSQSAARLKNFSKFAAQRLQCLKQA
jgi:hypothetical protein